MKLRNKKTGKIVEDTDILGLLASAKNDVSIYHSLAELNEEWEDVEDMPQIQDEPTRNVVKCWAKVNDLYEVLYDEDKDCIYSPYGSDKTDTSVSISFDECNVFKGLEPRKLDTINELCGEE